jgi:hypothetical protein
MVIKVYFETENIESRNVVNLMSNFLLDLQFNIGTLLCSNFDVVSVYFMYGMQLYRPRTSER